MAPEAKNIKIPLRRESAKQPATAINSPAPGTLFSLPPEIRNQIYKYALHLDNDVCEIIEGTAIPEPNLLLTCKVIRKEAIGSFYSETQFQLVSDSFSPSTPAFVKKKNIALSKQYKCEIKKAQFRFEGSPEWDNLITWLRLCHSDHGMKGIGTYSDPRALRENNFLAGLFKIAKGMRDKPWERVEDILNLMRQGLTKFNPEWAGD